MARHEVGGGVLVKSQTFVSVARDKLWSHDCADLEGRWHIQEEYKRSLQEMIEQFPAAQTLYSRNIDNCNSNLPKNDCITYPIHCQSKKTLAKFLWRYLVSHSNSSQLSNQCCFSWYFIKQLLFSNINAFLKFTFW